MITFKKRLKELLALSRENITFIGYEAVESETVFPAIRLRMDFVNSNTSISKYNFAFQMFINYPEGCETFESAAEKAEHEVQKYFDFMEELIVVGLQEHSGYTITGDFRKRVFKGRSSTQHKLIAIQLQGEVQRTNSFKCCFEGLHFDFSSLIGVSSTWSNEA